MIVALAGGVGGAKLILGLAEVLPPGQLTAVVKTADDLWLHGLLICPDLDTVLYTLAGLADPVLGWGVAGDTTGALEMLERYGHPRWFRLGDRDLATHLLRRALLDEGKSLTEVTASLSKALGVKTRILPMTDDRVQTRVRTGGREIPFQEYFVAHRAEVPIEGIRFEGIERARPSPQVLEALSGARAILFCPSNPLVSIGPILALSGMREALREAPGRKVAVSPIVGGKALKGPAARMMREIGEEASALTVARRYVDSVETFVLDEQDRELREPIRSLGLEVLVTDTIMKRLEDKVRLAREILNHISGLEGPGGR
jgi:LPPG:FO 2-phospho-L-lactate transferase